MVDINFFNFWCCQWVSRNLQVSVENGRRGEKTKVIFEITSGIVLALAFFALSVTVAYMVRKYDIALTRALAFFVGLTIFKLSSVFFFSYFLSKKGGNIFIFLIVFATAFSLMLIPEILVLSKVFTR